MQSLTPAVAPAPSGRDVIAQHWPEYLMEAALLALFMLSACVFASLLEHPASRIHQTFGNPDVRRALMGLAMGGTAAGLILSQWGQRSGAHMNPAVTLTFFALGKVAPWDAGFYVVAQFVGGALGVELADLLIGPPLHHGAVNYVVTEPQEGGFAAAFWAETVISAILMGVVLAVSNSRTLARWTPYFAGALVTIYILVEAPVSGMSMNPARTLGSAFAARQWTALWIYFTAPPLGMLAAGQLFRFSRIRVRCAKLHHDNPQPCIFRCTYSQED